MLDLDPAFRPVRTRDGYLRLEDLGLISDGATVALVGLDGSVPWLCVPRLDADPLFRGLLDHAGGCEFSVVPEYLIEARQAYQPADNMLRLGLEPEQLTLELTGIGARVGVLAPLTLSAQIEAPELPAYAGLLRQVLAGDAALSIRGDEAEESSRVVTPVLDAWSKDLIPLEEYAAGSEGPG